MVLLSKPFDKVKVLDTVSSFSLLAKPSCTAATGVFGEGEMTIENKDGLERMQLQVSSLLSDGLGVPPPSQGPAGSR